MPLSPDIIATINGIARDFYVAQLATSPRALELFRARGLDDASIAHWGLGYAPGGGQALLRVLAAAGWGEAAALEAGVARSGDRGASDVFRDRLMFPITDRDGQRVLGFGSRRMTDDDPSNPKYLNTSETGLFHKREVLYGMSNLADAASSDRLFLVEGNFDMLGLWHAGIRNVAALCGTSLTSEHLAVLSPVTHHLDLVLDADAAGQNATMRSLLLEGVSAFDMGVVPLAGGKDPDEIVREDPAAWARLVEGRVTRWDHIWKVTAAPFEQEAASSVEARVAWKDAYCELVTEHMDDAAEGRDLLKRMEQRLRLPAGLLSAEYLGIAEAPANEPALDPKDDLILLAIANGWETRRLIAPLLDLGPVAAAIRDRWLRDGKVELPVNLRPRAYKPDAEVERMWNVAVRGSQGRLNARAQELMLRSAESGDPMPPEVAAIRAAIAASRSAGA